MTELAQPLVNLQQVQASLAAELAVELLPVEEILKRFDLTAGQLRVMLKDPQFRSMIKQFRQEWHEAANAKERIRLKASLMVEDNLLELHALFNSIDVNPTSRLEAFKQMTQLADVLPSKESTYSGPKFNLTLNLGQGAEPVTIDAEPVATSEAS